MQSRKEWRAKDKARIAIALGHVCSVQKQFGKKASDLSAIADGFSFFLHDQDPLKVLKAIGMYVRKNPDIPTPSDILKVLSPTLEDWKPDWVFYQHLRDTLKSRGKYSITVDERDYIKACESYSLGSLKRQQNINGLVNE